MRLSILTLLAIVAFSAVCFAAVRPETDAWLVTLINAFVIAVAVLLIGSLAATGRVRSICIGALILGSAFPILHFTSLFRNFDYGAILPNPILNWFDTRGNYHAGMNAMYLMSFALAVAGGCLGNWFYNTSRAEP